MASPGHTSTTTRTSPLAALGWGFYLAVSWTWVIGMILPALMLRDFGWWGLAVFLVPNAIGAALMGTVLRDAESAKRLRLRHKEAIGLFSIVTIAFHLYVLGAIAMLLPRTMGLLVVCVVAAGLWFIALLRGERFGHLRGAAAMVWLTSVALAVVYIAWGGSDRLLEAAPYATNFSRDLLMLAPVVVFGFVLCPYLDATFLRARMETSPAGGRAGFAFGFLGPFVVMIGFTALYSVAITSGYDDLWIIVMFHLFLQSAFTVSVHSREGFGKRGGLLPSVALAVAAIVLAWLLPKGPIPWADNMLGREVVYRLFMSAYGLFFPAYVLFAVVPDAMKMGPLPKAGRAVTAVTIAAVLPLYTLGFIARQEQWLPLALGLLLGGAFITFTMRRRAVSAAHG